MSVFSYKGRSSRGELVQGSLEAPSIDAVASQLLNSGITPIDINEASERQLNIDIGRFLRSNRPPSLEDMILFSRQMYTLMKSGIPMIQSFNGLIQSTRNTRLVNTLRDILSNLESGVDLASSMSRHPDVFSTLFINMVRVGEETGRLDESFLRISEYLGREKEARERIKAAIRYPVIVIIAIGIAIGIINVYVIPAFATLFANAGVELPWQTRLLIATSSFFVSWWPVILALIMGSVIGFFSYIKTEKGRYNWDRAKLRIPLIGDIIHRATMGRFARAFSMALTSGVPLIQALTTVSRAIDNEYIGEYILSMRNGIQRGESLTRTAAVTRMFTPMVLQMISVGEETGAVDDLLVEVAEFYEREVDYDLKNMSAIIEPVLIIAIGAMVLILALGIMLPMWDIGTTLT